MKLFSIINRSTPALAAACLLLISLAGCKREPLVIETSTQVNITGYVEKYPEQFSEWKKVLDLTGNSGFLQAYGNYTMFLPTNDGVKAYLKDVGKTTVNEVSLNDLKDLVKFSLLEDTIPARKFIDGKLNTLTMLGQYLITGTTTTGAITTIQINRQANVIKADVRLGNGYVHIIDNVLRPSKLTAAQVIEANPNLSVFLQGLKETGLYDSLNILPAANPKTDQKFLTVLAESNAVLAAAGYGTYAALKAKYNTGNPDLKNAANALHAYFAYHILNDSKYLADIAAAGSHKTLAFPEIITSEFDEQQVVINNILANGVYDPGVVLDGKTSDVSASNGVVHITAPFKYSFTYTNTSGTVVTAAGTTKGQYEIKPRSPFPVYWDVADFPEARRNVLFRKGFGTGTYPFSKQSASAPSPIAGWNWPKSGDGPVYNNALSGEAWANRDFLNMFLGIISGNARQEWIEMRTPLIARGKYRVWVCYRRQNQSGNWPASNGTTARIRIDGGDPSAKVFHFAEPIPFGTTNELAALGWKYYTSTGNATTPFTKQTVSSAGAWNSTYIAKDLGIMDIKTTDVHTLRLEAVNNSQSTNNLDMFHFIPLDAPSQILPRFRVDGTQDFTNYPGN